MKKFIRKSIEICEQPDLPIFCCECNSILAKRAILSHYFLKDDIFIGYCWNCGSKLAITNNFGVAKID